MSGLKSSLSLCTCGLVVDGVWTEWSEWDDCSAPCGIGAQNRNRTCIPPKFGGVDCVGNYTETALCNTHPCPSK